jgi:hypothetical protein
MTVYETNLSCLTYASLKQHYFDFLMVYPEHITSNLLVLPQAPWPKIQRWLEPQNLLRMFPAG